MERKPLLNIGRQYISVRFHIGEKRPRRSVVVEHELRFSVKLFNADVVVLNFYAELFVAPYAVYEDGNLAVAKLGVG